MGYDSMMSYIVERLIANWEILRNKYCLRENELRPVSVCVNIALYDSMYYVVAGIKSPIINICTPYMQDSPFNWNIKCLRWLCVDVETLTILLA